MLANASPEAQTPRAVMGRAQSRLICLGRPSGGGHCARTDSSYRVFHTSYTVQPGQGDES